MIGRPRPPEPPRDAALKTLTRLLIEAVGGLDAAVAGLGGRVGRSRLAEYYAPHSPCHVPADIVARLEELAGQPLVTAELARRAGFALVPLDSGTAAPPIAALAAAAVREGAEATAAVLAALEDGRVTTAEAEHGQRQCLQAAAAQTLAAAGFAALRGGSR